MPSIGRVEVPQVLSIQPEHAVENSRSVLQVMKEKAISAWKVSLLTLKTAGADFSLAVFRAFEYCSPTLANKIEIVFLRLRDAWKTATSRNELNEVKNQNLALQAQLQQMHRLEHERGRLVIERDRLQEETQQLRQGKQFLEQANLGLNERVAALLQQQNNITQREEAAVRDRQLVLQEHNLVVTQLRAQQQELLSQRDEATQSREAALAAQRELQQQLTLLRAELPSLREEIALQSTQRVTEEQLALLAAAMQNIPAGPPEEKTEIDDILDRLLPQQIQQLTNLRTNLDANKARFQGTEEEVIVGSIYRRLGRIIDSLNRIPGLLRFHTDFHDPVRRLMHPTSVEA